MNSKRESNDLHLPHEEDDEEESNALDLKGRMAILWDIENCCVPTGVSPHHVESNLRKSLQLRGITAPVAFFSAYGDFSNCRRSLREGCQRSGVNLVDVPNGRKDAADKAILADMFLFAMDNPPPSTIFLISGDVDFAPALHKLGQRGYTILVAVAKFSQTCSELCNAAKFVWEWPEMVRNRSLPTTATESLCKKIKLTAEQLPAQGSCDMHPETIMEWNPTVSMLPCNIRPGDCGLSSETATAPNPSFSMEPSNVSLGDCRVPSETAKKASPTSSMQPTNIRPGDCTLLSESTPESHPASPVRANNTGTSDSGLPFEVTTELHPSSLMEPSDIRPGDCRLPSETTTIPNPTFLMQPNNIRPSGINSVKDELLMLLHGSNGRMPFHRVQGFYKMTFNKRLRLKVLNRLLRKENDFWYVTGKRKKREVCLRLQKNSNASQQNTVNGKYAVCHIG